jgi:hypothetical protein
MAWCSVKAQGQLYLYLYLLIMRERRNIYKILVRKLEGKKPFGRPRSSWENHIRMDLREIEWKGVDRIHLAQDSDQWWALVNKVMNLRFP